MRPTFILHIGLHKTGSTFLQNFCALNRIRLQELGVVYPGAATQWHAHHPLVWSMGVNHPRHIPENGDTAFYVRQIIEEFDEISSRCHTLLLSSEDFEFMNPRNMDVIKKLFTRFDIKILAYLRPQSSYLESEYAQHVRMDETRFTGSIKDFYMRFDFMQRYNYLNLLQPYADRFGREAIIVRPFERAQFEGGDLLQDFCSAIGITLDDTLKKPSDKDSNISISGDALRALRAMNKLNLTVKERDSVIGILHKHAGDHKGTRIMSSDVSDRFKALFRDSNALVARTYLGRSDGQLFLDDATSS